MNLYLHRATSIVVRVSNELESILHNTRHFSTL